MKIRAAIITVACLALSTLSTLSAAQPQPQPPPSPPATIADVAWLQGYWFGEGLGGTVEDVWFPPKAGVLLGAFRLSKADGTPGFYEIFAIEEFEGSLRFVVKHFNPDWVGWEDKDKAFRAKLTRLSATELAFGGIAFTRQGDDAMRLDLAMRGKDGATRTEVLTFKRRPL